MYNLRLPLSLLAALALSIGAAAAALAKDPGEIERRDSFRDAATAPLEDLNLRSVRIPAVLQRAVENPYDVAGLKRCEAVAAEVGKLDAALGADLDEVPPPDTRTRGQKLRRDAKDAGVAAVRSKTRSLIPFRGWVRKLTGAERKDKAVQKAIRAGGIRRGYLKGYGMRMNCAPPAAPSWFEPAPTRIESDFWSRLWSGLAAWIQSWWPF